MENYNTEAKKNYLILSEQKNIASYNKVWERELEADTKLIKRH